jgi:hypothetical protein
MCSSLITSSLILELSIYLDVKTGIAEVPDIEEKP